MDKSPKEFTLDAGTIVKINGLPYAFVEETKVSGFHEPEFPTYSGLDDSSRQERTSPYENMLDANDSAGEPTIVETDE